MGQICINSDNVGRIAERIVSNELEYRRFRISDLNQEVTSANADLLAAREGKTLQIQVKGATWEDCWWWGYGYCTDAIIAGKEPMFNRASSFYRAEFVVLVCVKSPREYSCLVLPQEKAEEAAQINLDRDSRTPKKDGSPKTAHKTWISLDWTPKTRNAEKQLLYQKEQELLRPYKDNWNIFEEGSTSPFGAAAP